MREADLDIQKFWMPEAGDPAVCYLVAQRRIADATSVQRGRL